MEFHSSVIPATNIGKSLDEIRRSMKFHPTIWGDYFLPYNSNKTEITVGEHEVHAKKKEMVKELLARVPNDSTYKLELIDAIQRLGVKYHFEKEIDESLRYIHEHHNSNDNDLSAVSLRFRLLRQQGLNTPCDVFKNFINNQGDFVESIKNNVEGLLQLYEAAHFGTNGEEILDKAIEFSSSHLQASLHQISISNASLSKRVEEALKTPILKGVPRLAARDFISMYEENESRNETVLKFAKLDFNIVQKMHQRELSELTRWWKKLDVANKMPYARDRVVELFFWITGDYFEPHFVTGRRLLTKAISMASIIDDTYEYATLAELQILTDAIQRWDVNEKLEDSPPHLQRCYRTVVQTYLEIGDELEKAGESYRLHYAKQEIKKLARAYFEEAKWLYNDYIPTVEEYMKVGLASSGYMMVSTTSLVGMGDLVRKQDFDWIANEPLMVRACSVICRLMDDLVGDKYEQKTSVVDCYMKQYGVSKDEACAEIRKEVKKAWKDMNEECLEPRPASMEILVRVFNLARVINLLYSHDDCYANSFEAEKWVKKVFADPVEF